MIAFPNAKINIGLFVTEKRNDGFHNLETIFYPVPRTRDILEIIDAETDSLLTYGIPVPGDVSQNLIMKALDMIRRDYEAARRPLKIILYKNIPMGAGLGGGSADAAFAIRLLNQHLELEIPEYRQLEYALNLGSDCPFFMINSPAFAKGRGELLSKIDLDLSAYSIQLVCPELHISTAQAFSGIRPEPAAFDLNAIIDLPITEWRHFVKNDFEKTIFPLFPALPSIKEQLYEQGAVYASLSGTGSTVYGIFPKGNKAHIKIAEAAVTYYQD